VSLRSRVGRLERRFPRPRIEAGSHRDLMVAFQAMGEHPVAEFIADHTGGREALEALATEACGPGWRTRP
jgi:hypothetical protein